MSDYSISKRKVINEMNAMQKYLNFISLSLALMTTILSAPVQAATLYIANDDELRLAIAAGAQGMDLELASGIYGPLNIRSGDAPATIRSKDSQSPATLRGLTVRGFEKLSIENINFSYEFNPEDKLNVRPFAFSNCKGLKLIGNHVHGDKARNTGTVADGHGYGIGLSVRFCQDVLIADNFISQHHRGLIVSESSDVIIRNNDLNQLRMDGMVFAQVDNISIENNRVHSFERVYSGSDHADMIQFWTASTSEPSREIVIRGNVLSSGAGGFTQSIFMRNEAVSKDNSGIKMFYRNILIEDNVIINAQLHGITVGETHDLIVRNNTLVQNPDSAGGNPHDRVWVPSIRIADRSKNVTVTGNIVSDQRGFMLNTEWNTTNNLIIQNSSPGQPNHYSKVFADWSGGNLSDPQTYHLGVGAPPVGAVWLRQ